MIGDIFKSIQAYVGERLVSPLIGSFVISWCLWNYKFFVILFSSASVRDTFSLINEISFPDTTAILTKGIVYPLLTALGYIFLYPYPARWVYRFNVLMQKALVEIKQRIDDETPVNQETVRKIRASAQQQITELQKEVDRKDEEIERLKALQRERGTDIATVNSELAAKKQLSAPQINLLNIIRTFDEEATDEQIFSALHATDTTTRSNIRYQLNILAQEKFVTVDHAGGNRTYSLTQKGRYALIEQE